MRRRLMPLMSCTAMLVVLAFLPAAAQSGDTARLSLAECLDAALGYYRALSRKLPPGQRKRITVPTVVFAGLDDGVLSVKAYHKAARRFEGDYRVIEMPGGHFMHREHPEHFIEQLLGVLD